MHLRQENIDLHTYHVYIFAGGYIFRTYMWRQFQVGWLDYEAENLEQ